ncbi:hypothetical protein SPLC1_S050200 [Arthrospira platensis C1]|nr:hypothetical protein SPLC1_S050200 [Arthrospira platensis C1]
MHLHNYSHPKSVVEDDGRPQPSAAKNGRGLGTNHLGLLYVLEPKTIIRHQQGVVKRLRSNSDIMKDWV